MAEAEDPFRYGTIEVPTVIGLLKNILTQYPDNGQIIKELIQNAEDAGASEVEIVHDARTLQFPRAQQDIRRFVTGPSLCLYNNAVFTEKDWEGICRLSESIKKDDPLKVGQFGLGFKSVFHVTDYVTIVSGRNVLFMDPSEPEARMCRSVHLSDLGRVCVRGAALKMWGAYLSSQDLDAGHFKGTLFWFPLRQQASQLSSTIYSWDNVDQLFDSFSNEAPHCLTFLRSLEQVRLKRVTDDDMLPRVLHQVELVEPNLNDVRQKRRELRCKLEECGGCPMVALTYQYHATIQSARGSVETRQTMLIMHHLPGQHDLTRVRHADNKSCYMPLVGVAAPTDPSVMPWVQGHLFSFLPLPLDAANTTGLPVQVNAYFILDQSRRHVKWRTHVGTREPDATWNEELVSRVVLEAYKKMMMWVHSEARHGRYKPDVWYSMLPDLRSVSGRWNTLAEQLWRSVLDTPILNTEMHGFMKPQEVVTNASLSKLQPIMSNCIWKFLQHNNLPLVSALPDHLTASLKNLESDLGDEIRPPKRRRLDISNCSLLAHDVSLPEPVSNTCPREVTPQLVRDILRMTSSVQSECNKMVLLEYAMLDGSFHDLQGLPLLPLNNGAWTTFSGSSEPVYLCTAAEAGALWGLGATILLTIAPHHLLSQLHCVAQTGTTQLILYQTQEHCCELLSKSVEIMKQSTPSSQDLQNWLKYVWSLIQHMDLQKLSHLPLLPLSSPLFHPSNLTPLDSHAVVQDDQSPLCHKVIRALSLLNVPVIPQLPSYVQHHQLHSYIHASVGQGVIQALAHTLRSSSVHNLAHCFNTKKSSDESEAFIAVIDHYSLQGKVKELIAKLDIFKAVTKDGNVKYSSVERVRKIRPLFKDFPVHFPVSLLELQSEKHRQLAQMLGAQQLSKEELCIISLKNRTLYSDEEITKLTVYIMKDRSLMASQKIFCCLQSLNFVPNVSGTLHMPEELYDPEDSDSDALIGEDLFPSHLYHQYLPVLIQLGLKKVVDMPQHLLEQVIVRMPNVCLCYSEKKKKSAALLRVLEQHSNYLEVCEAVRNVAFVCGITQRPSNYPEGLIWATQSNCYSPATFKSCYKYQDVLGSVVQLVECSHLPNVAECFGWNQDPDISFFLQHMKNFLGSLSAENDSEIVKKVYKYLSRFTVTSEAKLIKSFLASLECVLTDDGFKFPHQVFITKSRDDLQLSPYMYPLRSDLKCYSDLFKLLGCLSHQSVDVYLSILKQIKEHHHSEAPIEVIFSDRKLVVCMLEKLAPSSDVIQPSQLLLPVENDDRLELIEIKNCYYLAENSDVWLSSDEIEVRVVHRSVSPSLALSLGVKQLRDHLVAGGDAAVEWGQHEPLTTRLHSLLSQYRDGVGIFKEMVQNADDAGATNVAFLYDERQNSDARTKLLHPQLEGFQGPALWVYNDATFTENDFHNLRSLGAGTKKLQLTKIGKFGLGFCSVYNLTDVPSFVSGSNFVIFDPHHSFGMRYNFEEKKALLVLKNLDGQFKPFSQVFNCKIQETNNFPGTLFRLPLRTTAQAATSKISGSAYGQSDMVQLLQMFREVVGELLLYTQQVEKIQVFHLSSNVSSPTKMKLLFESSKEFRNVPHLNHKVGSPMKKVRELFRERESNLQWNGTEYEEITLSDISVINTEAGKKLCGKKVNSWTVTWLTSWHSGKGPLCHLAEGKMGKPLPLGAVSTPVVRSKEGWEPRLLKDLPLGFYKDGHLHCFLPLPVKTQLPVQVNGFFEVTNDRTNLLSQSSDDRHNFSWNTTLLTDAVTSAYHGLLSNLISIGQCLTPYYALWPLASKCHDTHTAILVKSFYCDVVSGNFKFFQSSCGWHPLSHCLFLEDALFDMEGIGDIAFECMEAILHSSESKFMIKLPAEVQTGFEGEVILKHCVRQDAFYQKFFLPHISSEIVTPQQRDQLTLHLIDNCKSCVMSLEKVACIPVKPNGKLGKPGDIVQPRSKVSEMYSVSDERFPENNFVETKHRCSTLLTLGMRNSTIPAEWVCERANSVARLSCVACALSRAQQILFYISAQNKQEKDAIASRVNVISFLPIMAKPPDWPYVWKGDKESVRWSKGCPKHSRKTRNCQRKSVAFAAPNLLCLPDFEVLLGSSHLILQNVDNQGHMIMPSVLAELGLMVDPLQLPLQSIIDQLMEFASVPEVTEKTYKRCHEVYKHLERCLNESNSHSNVDMQRLRSEKVLLTRHGFVEPEFFAMSSETDCSPDLYSAELEDLTKYRMLMEVLGIKRNFTFEVVLKALLKKRESFGTSVLGDDEILNISKLLGELFKVREKDAVNHLAHISSLHLPDTEGHLHSVGKLCIDDGASLSSGEYLCLHKGINCSQDMLHWLGLKSKTRRRLEDLASRMHFGQREPLTTRLKNILQDYPCDAGIMKELLQNADDAGATKVAFICDFRNLPCEKLFDKRWKPLQGPALSVYNNKGFTARDLQSIQDLGNSSKKEDPASTGQYGIGFNAVYHLSDAPSFLTRGPGVPGGETLCMFDPHCWYDPWATVEKPGIQLTDLKNLRKDHPDSFLGYLEGELLKEEGTVFRLPLRTTDKSLISGNVWRDKDVEKMISEFKAEMSKSLLFLRNIRQISVLKVNQSGKISTKYSVKSELIQESKSLSKSMRKNYSSDKCSHLYALKMKRESYYLDVTDTMGQESSWYVMEQIGVENVDSVPELVKEAFHHGYLNMNPHAAVAILLNSSPRQKSTENLITTSCYLPLPSESGLPFSINGHFTLSSSRRDLWKGSGDVKAMWNQWLMKEILVPVAAHALDNYRISMFDSGRDIQNVIEEHEFNSKVKSFHDCLPNFESVTSDQWKDFTKLFYEYVRNHQLHFFDVFIPETDETKDASGIKKPRSGKLEWHAFKENGHQFPVYFPNESEELNLDTLKRLGMKVASKDMCSRMKKADREFKYPSICPGTVMKFLLSWNKNFQDKCKPFLNVKVHKTPFLCTQIVQEFLCYILQDDSHKNCISELPLLLTNDCVLRAFNQDDPVFVTSYCCLVPEIGKEFVHKQLVRIVQEKLDSFEAAGAVKQFTLEDLNNCLLSVFDSSYQNKEAVIELKETSSKLWIMRLWEFMISSTEKLYKAPETTTNPTPRVNWEECRKHIMEIMGKWAVYPIVAAGKNYLVPINNAWQVLKVDEFEYTSIFKSMLVFTSCPHFEHLEKLKLAASKKDPQSVLEVLYFHRNKIDKYMGQRISNFAWQRKLDKENVTLEILEYFGKHCKEHSLSKPKLSALRIYKDVADHYCCVNDCNLIVPKNTSVCMDKDCSPDILQQIACERGYVVLRSDLSKYMSSLYNYLDPHVLVDDLVIYAELILPSLKDLNENQKMFFLRKLKDLLSGLQVENVTKWSESQKKVVSILQKTKFMKLDGELVTAIHFYDPRNHVFEVMKLCLVPKKWMNDEWLPFLKLAGMIHTVTPDMFVKFAHVLQISDPEVEEKSKALVKHLHINTDFLCEVAHLIKDIEFLVPHKMRNSKFLEKVLPHHKTQSGLVSFSRGVHSKFGKLLWSTVGLLPLYATPCELLKKFSVSDTAPEKEVLEHITSLCDKLQKGVRVADDEIIPVMEDIYKYLSNNTAISKILKDNEVPVVHIPDCRKFVPALHVVENLEQEIIPYLYKAPVWYGKFYSAFRTLGMEKHASSDTYARVLERVYDNSQQMVLNPEETRKMKLTMKGLAKLNVTDLTVDTLYLPTRDGTLCKSTEMYVADNQELLSAAEGKLKEPLFIGFSALDIRRDNCEFVKKLPEGLQPKFLSDVVVEELQLDGVEEVSTPESVQLKETLKSETIKLAILRVYHHQKMEEGSGLNREEEERIRDQLSKVSVRQVQEVTVVQKFEGNEIARVEKPYFVQKETVGKENAMVLYIPKGIPPTLLLAGLNHLYQKLLNLQEAEVMRSFTIIFSSIWKPHDVHKLLDKCGIKDYKSHSFSKRPFNFIIGSYLEEMFLHFLDNQFGQFNVGEIVCMKKYASGDDDDDDTFIIVQVFRLVHLSSTGRMMDEYEVNLGEREDRLAVVKAHQLYKFVRMPVAGPLVLFAGVSSFEEDQTCNEEEMCKKIRQQLREIWEVRDEKERRHLLRRLVLQVHPDKNPDHVQVYTRLFQDLQRCVAHLERGETIPDDSEHNSSEGAAPNTFSAYHHTFRPPPPQYTRSHETFGSAYERYTSGSQDRRRRMGDQREANKWWRHASHDLEEAERCVRGHVCWVLYICHQAAEKFIKACLYSVDRQAALEWCGNRIGHDLSKLCSRLGNQEALQLVREIEVKIGVYSRMRYPGHHGCPCDWYSEEDGEYVLARVQRIKDLLGVICHHPTE